MSVKTNLRFSYDGAGDLIITIPKICTRHIDQIKLKKSIENLISSGVSRKTESSANWDEDSAKDIVGICRSGFDDGSVEHDKFIYGLK